MIIRLQNTLRDARWLILGLLGGWLTPCTFKWNTRHDAKYRLGIVFTMPSTEQVTRIWFLACLCTPNDVIKNITKKKLDQLMQTMTKVKSYDYNLYTFWFDEGDTKLTHYFKFFTDWWDSHTSSITDRSTSKKTAPPWGVRFPLLLLTLHGDFRRTGDNYIILRT